MPEQQPFSFSRTFGTFNQGDVSTHRIFNIGSFILSVYGSLTLIFHHHSHKDGFQNNETPFSANILFVLGFWGLFYLLQLGYLAQFLNNVGNSLPVSWHYTLFNLFHFVWTIFYKHEYYLLSEIILIINFFNILVSYFNHQTYKYRVSQNINWLLIHLPTGVFPLTWLLYGIFWNGAILFHIHHLFGRIVSNVLIWDFLVVPGLFLILFNDWAFGLTNAYLTLGIGLSQLFTKLFALQWIFAFIISGLLFVFSLIVAIRGEPHASLEQAINGDQAPLLA